MHLKASVPKLSKQNRISTLSCRSFQRLQNSKIASLKYSMMAKEKGQWRWKTQEVLLNCKSDVTLTSPLYVLLPECLHSTNPQSELSFHSEEAVKPHTKVCQISGFTDIPYYLWRKDPIAKSCRRNTWQYMGWSGPTIGVWSEWVECRTKQKWSHFVRDTAETVSTGT